MLYIDKLKSRLYNMSMNSEKNNVIALIADIINSRKIQNRAIFQKEFIDVINNINNRFDEFIVSKFTVTTGDEFQGLVNNASIILDIVTYIKSNFKDVNFRYGVGIGSIVTDINKNIAIGADGPAYYMAREAINYVKAIENSNKKAKTDILIQSEVPLQKLAYINLLLKNNFYLYSKMSNRQRELVNFFILNNEIKEKDTSNILSISQQSINKSLHSAGFYYYKENYEFLKSMMEDIINVG